MPELQVGKTTIPYSIRFSRKARKRRIVVRPDKVEVVAPRGDSEKALHELIHKKREWVFNKQAVLKEKTNRIEELTTYRMRSGAKIPYRGRNLRLRINPSDADRIKIEYKTRFLVHKPQWANEEDLRHKMELWFKNRLQEDVDQMVEKYAPMIGVEPGRITFKDMISRWGSCGKSGDISLNLRLIHLPKNALEYVVIHELCHLRYRSHSKRFWELVESVMPGDMHSSKTLEGAML